ncbi:MAG: helix-turn-helix transcriptional regulator [Aureibaculum sp.]|nr:helix-turn-helix transcriptional regulator [Aureibaculum sp.]
MINNMDFAHRLNKVMDYYQLSAAAFADKISVQRSSISHLLSGRNRPSLDFVLKVLEEFKDVELYWLLNGKGSFPKKEDTGTTTPLISDDPAQILAQNSTTKEIDSIIIFYTDGTFKNYVPNEQKKS